MRDEVIKVLQVNKIAKACDEFFRPLLEAEETKRIERQNIESHLKHFEKAIVNFKQIDYLWKNFNQHLVSDVDDEIMVIDDQTQTFLDCYKYSAQTVSLSLHSVELASGGTRLHHQRKSNLCVAFAITSLLRGALKEFAIRHKQLLSKEIICWFSSKTQSGVRIPFGLSIDEVLEGQYIDNFTVGGGKTSKKRTKLKPSKKITNIITSNKITITSFESMRDGFINCVR